MAKPVYFDVELVDVPDPVRVRILTIDSVLVEREMSRQGQRMDDHEIECTARLAWSALRRRAQTDPDLPPIGDFDEFCAIVSSIEAAPDPAPAADGQVDELEDPTRPAAGPGSP